MNTIETKDKDVFKWDKIKQGKEVVIDRANLPLNIIYKGKRYILILTKNDKLILNKSTD